MSMIRGDFLHAVAKVASLHDRDALDTFFGLSAAEKEYVDYCCMASDPDQRSYDHLRGFLRWNVETHRATLKKMLNECRVFLDVHGQTPAMIYDVGCGHDAWCQLLGAVWPKAQVFGVDRFKVSGLGRRSLENDAVGFLEGFHGSEQALLFMSEFVHTKQRNLDVLGSANIAKFPVIVVELDKREKEIDDRLRQTGGRLVTPDEVLAARGGDGVSVLQRYESTFRYYSLLMVPA